MSFWEGIVGGIKTGYKLFKGAKNIKQAAQSIFGDIKGQPGQRLVPSLVGQAPDLNFVSQGGRMGLMEGSGKKGYAGDLRLDRPTADSGNEWLNLQRNYLAYLNMAEDFEEPGKVRRAVKLTV